MKKIAFFASLLFVIVSQAQLKIPQASPASKVEQTVGLTTITVNYSRPSAKGRTVFGELVPYGKNWRTGANENTKVTFSDEVTFGDKKLAKGTYALFTTPKADVWDIYFYKTTDNWGLPEEWKEENVALKLSVTPESTPRMTETFTISIDNLSTESAVMTLAWEKTVVPIKIDISTKANVIKNIEDVLDGPSAREYFTAAQYYYQNETDISKSFQWINQAIGFSKENEAPYWYYRLKSLIQFKMGDKKGAIETAKISLAGSQKANNQDYVKQNEDSIALWSKK
jgi:hypothetical protein